MRAYFFILGLVVLGIWGCASGGVKMGGVLHPLSDIQKAIVAAFPKGLERVGSSKRVFYSKFFNPEDLDFGEKNSSERDNRKEQNSREQKIDSEEIVVDEEELTLFRAQVVATVLGSSRPYTLQIKVFVDERKDEYLSEDKNKLYQGEWDRYGADDELEEYFLRKIKSILAKHHRTKNIIDDFRTF